VAEVVRKLRAIASTTIQETMRRKVFYIGLALLALILFSVISGQTTMSEANDAGETQIVLLGHTQMLETVFEVWSRMVVMLAAYLGAVAMHAEVTAKTIPNILSRPVERSTYLTGRWLGTLAFLWAFELVGLALGVLMVRMWDVGHSPLLWMGCAATFVAVVLTSGVALSLSVGMHPALAGVIAYILPFLPDLLSDAVKYPRGAVRLLALAGYYLAPASMPADLISESFDQQLRHPTYALYGHVLLENLGYAIAVFVVACAMFKRRELKLR
jgi:ABC-type transport system involved in multi-copper enzyme maturation permease subunit